MNKGRVLIGVFGMDQHENGAFAAATILRDAGMEVVYAGRFNTPGKLVRVALDEDVDVIGVSCHSWEYLEYTPELLRLLKVEGLDAAVVLGGSVITPADREAMKKLGVNAVFGPGTTPEAVVAAFAALIAARREAASGPA